MPAVVKTSYKIQCPPKAVFLSGFRGAYTFLIIISAMHNPWRGSRTIVARRYVAMMAVGGVVVVCAEATLHAKTCSNQCKYNK